MNALFFAVSTVGAAAAIFVLYFFLVAGRKWRRTVWLKRHGLEADARILHAQVINEQGRYLPFVRLKAEVDFDSPNSFVAEVDSLFSASQLMQLAEGTVVRVVYNPADNSDIMVVPQPSLIKQQQHWQPEFTGRQLVAVS